MPSNYLTALPVYNEANHIEEVLTLVRQYSKQVLVVDDGSSDGTANLLKRFSPEVHVVTHPVNRGYGAALATAFEFAVAKEFEFLVTIDCDGQHQPQRIGDFVAAIEQSGADIVSGSRYLQQFDGDTIPPAERRNINVLITAEINRRLGLQLTDAFCGFKAYRTSVLSQMQITESGYAMPLEVWAQAVKLGCQIEELAVPLIYLEEERSFGGALDDGNTRLECYHLVLDRSVAAVQTSRHTIDQSSPQFSLCSEDCSR